MDLRILHLFHDHHQVDMMMTIIMVDTMVTITMEMVMMVSTICVHWFSSLTSRESQVYILEIIPFEGNEENQWK